MIKHYAVVLAFCFLAAGCSAAMEASRPTPMDMSQFKVGESRLDVITTAGPPVSSTKIDNKSCDMYKLYTKGSSALGKAAIATGEVVADVATLGIAEILSDPTEHLTKNEKHPVIFCYSPDEKLISINQSDSNVSD